MRAPVVEVPPGVDLDRFRPLSPEERAKARAAWGLPVGGPLVVSISRLVPRKGMDVLIAAAAALEPSFPGLTVAIAGEGRDLGRLRGLVRQTGAPVRLLGRVDDEDLPRLYGAADLFAMACRNRWLDLEQEGFGIVFLEAAAAGVAQVAGRSGGADEAVIDGETGLVVADPDDPGAVAHALRQLLGDDDRRRRMGRAARARVEESFGYGFLARRLADALQDVEG
jgi:phosphatidylinositol alpha-1,6-mannosyltransferase